MHKATVFYLIGISLLLTLSLTAMGAPGDVEKIQRAIREQGAKWQAGETQYTSLPPEEIRAMLGLLPGYADPQSFRQRPHFPGKLDDFDSEVDWRNRNGGNYVTPVRNQGGCGSCWAFGGVATLEARTLIQGNTPGYPLDLSEQYLVSCSAGSCNGWYADATMDFLQYEGSPDESCLIYAGSDLIPCTNRCDDWFYRIRQVQSWGTCYNVAEMKAALNQGPIVGCFTVYSDFMAYNGGIYQHVWGGQEGGHMISIVGYSEADSCWICKNSWGGSWGEDGYFRILMYTDECGIESWAPLWAIADNADFPTITVTNTQVVESIGDGDGVFNPGETISLTINLQNAPMTTPAQGVTAQISCSDPRVTILDDQAVYPDLNGGQIAANVDPFALSATANCALGTVTLTMLITANESGAVPYVVEREVLLDLSLNQAGFPVAGLQVEASPAICDLNGDGNVDVISVDYAGMVKAVNFNGVLLAGFPYQASAQIKGSPAVADLDGDSDLEIVFADWTGHLYVLNANGTPALAPIALPFYVSATPALADLDDDGDLEIIQGCWDGGLYAYHHDGTPVAGFPFQTGLYQAIQEGALLLDVNNDNLPEIIFGSYNHNLYCLDGSGIELWHFDLGEIPGSAPSAANLAFDEPIIVIPTESGRVFFIKGSGTVNRMISLGASCKSCPAIADVDSDGDLEIALNDQAGYVHLLNLHGENVPGFPVLTSGCILTATSFSDLDNDGSLELVVVNSACALNLIEPDGSSLPGFPIQLSQPSNSTPAIAYLDDDQDMEIVLGTYSGLNAIDYKQPGGSNNSWNMFRGNLCRTGNYGDGFLPDGGSLATVTPSLPVDFTWYPAHPNPFNPDVTLSFQLPAAAYTTLRIFDLLGRQVATLVDGFQMEGRHTVSWSAQNGGAASGIYVVAFHANAQDGKVYQATEKVVLVK